MHDPGPTIKFICKALIGTDTYFADALETVPSVNRSALQSLRGTGRWLGGTLFVTAATFRFRVNAWNRPQQRRIRDIVIPAAEVTSLGLFTTMWVVDVMVLMGHGDRGLKVRGWGLKRRRGQISALTGIPAS